MYSATNSRIKQILEVTKAKKYLSSSRKIKRLWIRTRDLTSSERSSKDAKGAGPMRFCLCEFATLTATEGEGVVRVKMVPSVAMTRYYDMDLLAGIQQC